jgi:hypothetical protein
MSVCANNIKTNEVCIIAKKAVGKCAVQIGVKLSILV